MLSHVELQELSPNQLQDYLDTLIKEGNIQELLEQEKTIVLDHIFSITGSELELKILYLGINQEDLVRLSEGKNDLEAKREFIDKYFTEILQIYNKQKLKTTKYISGFDIEDPKELEDLEKSENKRELLGLLSYNRFLKVFFDNHSENIDLLGDLVAYKKTGLMNFSYIYDQAQKLHCNIDIIKLFNYINSCKNDESKYFQKLFEMFYSFYFDKNGDLNNGEINYYLLDDLLDLVIISGNKEELEKNIKYFSGGDDLDELFIKNYDLIMKLGKISGKNNYIFFSNVSITSINDNREDIDNNPFILEGLKEFGEDICFGRIIDPSFIQYYIKNFSDETVNENPNNSPNKFNGICENIKKIADLSGKNSLFYNKCYSKILDFIVKYPDKIEFLLKLGEEFSGNIVYLMGEGIDIIYKIIEKYPDNYSDFFEKVIEIGDGFEFGNKDNFINKGLIRLVYFLDESEERFLEEANNLKNTVNINKIEGNKTDVFFGVGLNFATLYAKNEHLKSNKSTEYLADFNSSEFLENTDITIKPVESLAFREITSKIAELIGKYLVVDVNNKSENTFQRYMDGFFGILKPKFHGYYRTAETDFEKLDFNDNEFLDEVLNYFSKIGNRKDDVKVIYGLTNDFYRSDSENQKCIISVLKYLLKYKKNQIIPFIKNLNLTKSFPFNLNEYFSSEISLEHLSEELLEKVFIGKSLEETDIYIKINELLYNSVLDGNKILDIEYKKVKNNYISSDDKQLDNTYLKELDDALLLNKAKLNSKYKKRINEVKNILKQIFIKEGSLKQMNKEKSLPFIIKIQNILSDLLLNNFEKEIYKNIYSKIKDDFNLEDDFDFEKITDEFIQNYAFYLNLKVNKPQLKELLSKYLKGETYTGGKGINKKYPYNIPENQKFLREAFGFKKFYWLYRNEKTFEIDQTSNNTQARISHHLNVSNDKLQELGLKNNFENHQSLVVFFDENIKTNELKFDSDIFSDLELQINQIKKLLIPIEGKNIKSVKIYHELNPFKILQMGNVVDGSCLAFEGSNSWSTVSNALEINKGVFYFEDENGNIIGRVLLGVDKKGNFDMHPIYIKGNVTINLDKYFKIYIEELALKIGTKTNGRRRDTTLLFCERWYEGD